MEAGVSLDSRGSAARVAPGASVPDLLAWGGLLLAVGWFLLIKSYCFHWQVSDENIYYYMAWAAVDHGALPYRDFFFAHPPLHLLPGIAAFALFGFGPFTAPACPSAPPSQRPRFSSSSPGVTSGVWPRSAPPSCTSTASRCWETRPTGPASTWR